MKTFIEYLDEQAKQGKNLSHLFERGQTVSLFGLFNLYYQWMLAQEQSSNHTNKDKVLRLPVNELLNQLKVVTEFYIQTCQQEMGMSLVAVQQEVNLSGIEPIVINDDIISQQLKTMHTHIYQGVIDSINMSMPERITLGFIGVGIIVGMGVLIGYMGAGIALAATIGIFLGLGACYMAYSANSWDKDAPGLDQSSAGNQSSMMETLQETLSSVLDTKENVGYDKYALQSMIAQTVLEEGDTRLKAQDQKDVKSIAKSITKAMVVPRYAGMYTDTRAYLNKVPTQYLGTDMPAYDGCITVSNLKLSRG